jgi:hypothetical protein
MFVTQKGFQQNIFHCAFGSIICCIWLQLQDEKLGPYSIVLVTTRCHEMLKHISYASQDENTFNGPLFTQGASIITKDFTLHYSSTHSPTSIIFKTSQGNIGISINPSTISK